MNRPPQFLGLLFLCLFLSPGSSHAGLSSFGDLEMLTSLGALQMWQTADWIEADTLIAVTNREEKCFDEFDIASGWFIHVGYCPVPAPCLLTWKHPRFRVIVYPEEPVSFDVLYFDSFGNPPLPGYPRAIFWREGVADPVATLILDAEGTEEGKLLYRKEIPSLQPGLYHYKYVVKNSQLPDEYSLETSSFAVTLRPSKPDTAQSVPETTVSNSKVNLRWNANDGAQESLTYRLFAGTDADHLNLVYEGKSPHCQLTELDYGRRYYWIVEAVNPLGIASRSPLNSFSTLLPPARSFNYPNPFNPAHNEATNIVFDMVSAGAAEIAVFSEMGDLCWSRSFDGLLKGVNEIRYDGRDDHGRVLYNGTYVCSIKRKYIDRTDNDTCRILVIK